MKTLKLEMAIAGAALFALGAFIATRPDGAEAISDQPAGARAFSESDFNAFSRGFLIRETPCAIGLEAQKICFTPAPIEKKLEIGMVIPEDVPLVAAEFRVIVMTDLKDEALRTVRFGQTLVLIDPETRVVVDMLRLSAPHYRDARTPAVRIG